MDKVTAHKSLDPVKTRETILAAAWNVFAENGFDGASLAQIACRAGVPKSLLQYHFGSKEDLWTTCLVQKLAPLLEPLDRFLANPDAANLADLIAVRFQIFQDNPQAVRLLAWASLGTTPLPPFLTQRRTQFAQIGPQDPSLIRLLFALSAMDGWFSYRPLYQHILGGTVAQDTISDQFRQLLLNTISDAEEKNP